MRFEHAESVLINMDALCFLTMPGKVELSQYFHIQLLFNSGAEITERTFLEIFSSSPIESELIKIN